VKESFNGAINFEDAISGTVCHGQRKAKYIMLGKGWAGSSGSIVTKVLCRMAAIALGEGHEEEKLSAVLAGLWDTLASGGGYG
jgi:hypothetical protein